MEDKFARIGRALLDTLRRAVQFRVRVSSGSAGDRQQKTTKKGRVTAAVIVDTALVVLIVSLSFFRSYPVLSGWSGKSSTAAMELKTGPTVLTQAGNDGDSSGTSSAVAGAEVRWNPDYGPLQQQLRERVSDLTRETGQEWGIYFEDLTSGKTFGVNEDLNVPAASTVKVPVVLYASYLVSRGELSWDERVTYVASSDWRGGSGSLQFTAKDGDAFTIRELAEKAIVESDNIAWKLLEKRLGKGNIAEFMRQLGGSVVYPNGENISTPRDMALYMKSALSFSRQSPEGEKLMYDLAHTIWNTGLNRFIDKEVVVAHKEGDVTGVANDVGVVFAKHPYVLAIMSKGHYDVEAGFAEIGRISKTIYDYQMSLETR